MTILSDDLTELTEFFEAVLIGVDVLASGTIQILNDQERNRIQFSPVQAQVNIIDADGEFILCLQISDTYLQWTSLEVWF